MPRDSLKRVESSARVSHLRALAKPAAPARANPALSDGSLEQRERLRLRVIATTDLHAQLLSYDYFSNRPLFGTGLAQTASLIATARAEVRDCLLLDNGDFLQGSALSEVALQMGRRRIHPAIAAFNALRYDAITLGNHEFDYGLSLLESALEHANFPVVSANVARKLQGCPTQDQLFVAPWTMIERQITDRDGQPHALKIGILGLTPPQIVNWEQKHLAGQLYTRPMVEAARAWVPEMRAAGADLVICLAHSGVLRPGQPPGPDYCAAEIALIEGVDAVIAGHSHQVFPQPDHPGETALGGMMFGKPIVQPGHSGSHLGLIDLWLTHEEGKWEIAQARGAALSVTEMTAGLSTPVLRKHAAPLREALESDHRAALNWMRKELGTSDVALSTYFATAADSQALRLISAAMIEHARAGLKGRPEAHLPLLASVTPYRAGGRGGSVNYTDIPAGALSQRHVFDLYAFPNSFVAELTTGAAIRERLIRSSALFNRIQDGRPDQPLIDISVPASIFEIIPGLHLRYDLSQPYGSRRIAELNYQGRPLEDTDPFVLVTNSFLASIWAQQGNHILLDDGKLCSEILGNHIRKQGRLGAMQGDGWGFTPMSAGTSVIYDSGPTAFERVSEVAHMRPEFLSITPEGFHRFRLHL